MKRFYKEAAAGEAAEAPGFYAVLLDGRPVKTPAKRPLAVRSRALAEAIAAEWESQGEEVVPQSMPLMALTCSALDLIPQRREEEIGELAAFGETELLCYRSEHPGSLADRQAATWQPLLDWAERHLDAPLKPVDVIVHQPQEPKSLAALRRAIEAHDDLQLAALSLAVRSSGSLVIGLALSHGALTPEEAFEAAELEASYQIELWGEDAEAEKRRTAVREDLEAARRLFELVRTV
jgi:chaperone required for assembly of F1-ATPase